VKVGVLALQGAFAAHVAAFDSLGITALEVRSAEQLADVDRLVVPGGESTTISMMLQRSALVDPLREYLCSGRPVFGTCAGAILLAARIDGGRPDQISFAMLDMTVHRNDYGTQRESFETDLRVTGIDGEEFHAVFIRAPRITQCGDSVDVLAVIDGSPALVRSGSIMCSTFHPELSGDPRLHEMFVSMPADSAVGTGHERS
jgi:5'-phosphate synthase pdxT subunit